MNCAEHFIAATGLAKQVEYRRFGITDCGLSSLGREVTVVTTNFDLAGVLQARGSPVINFNNYRQSRLLGE